MQYFQSSPTKGKNPTEVIGRATETRDLCQATTKPYRLFDTPQQHVQTSKIGFLKDLTSKHQKLEYSSNQFNSKANGQGIDVRNYYLTTIKDIDIDVSSKTHL